jgi:hypothetical protein
MMTQSPGKPIYGTGNHFEWGENQILKLYGPEVPRDFIKELGRREKKLFESGFPVPEVGELIEFEDSLGQVYERIEGKSIGEELVMYFILCNWHLYKDIFPGSASQEKA